MPHGKKYDAHERECIAKAFAKATCNKIKGKDHQLEDDFHQNMFDYTLLLETRCAGMLLRERGANNACKTLTNLTVYRTNTDAGGDRLSVFFLNLRALLRPHRTRTAQNYYVGIHMQYRASPGA